MSPDHLLLPATNTAAQAIAAVRAAGSTSHPTLNGEAGFRAPRIRMVWGLRKEGT